MQKTLAKFLLGFFLLAAAFGPRLVLAEQMPVKHSCHQAPTEIPAACAVHCFSKAIAESETEVAPAPIFDFFLPAIIDFDFPELESQPQVSHFLEDGVFRDTHLLLTTIKRE